MKKATFVRSLPIRIKKNSSKVLTRANKYVNTHPMRSFFGILGAILVLIILSNIITSLKPKAAPEVQIVKTVSTYNIGSAPKITVAAKIKKSGVVHIAAQTNGIVSAIYKREGDSVQKGELLVSLSSNYQGGNALTLQRQIAQQQYQTVLDTYQTQKDLISNQRSIADSNKDNSDKLRDITNQSLNETHNLINLNQEILNTLDTNLNTLMQNSSQNSDLILSTKQIKSQFQAATNQAQQALRVNDYNQSGDNPPAQISETSRDATIKQLSIQEKQLDMNREATRLQLSISQINESLFFPVAPFSGTIQQVNVVENQQITPGATLMTISQTQNDPVTAVAFVSQDVAQRISKLEESTLHLGNKTYKTTPSFVSSEAVQGTLYAVYYDIPQEYSKLVTSEGFIQVDIPIGVADTTMSATYIPIDAVYQTRDKSYVFVGMNDKAKSRDVTLGQVYGSYVEILSGLKNGDSVILDRNIIQEDLIKIQQN